ncbi:end-filament protein [Acidianus manzaensis]|uniref:End-filament protein n=1 Tax=Acidianus manzaensis TaxID=282676 RepID=A0A1W6K1M1_9CREN|nr:end-filament protein [Acidianus manzaensis]ARM76433.1 end-filament protein [Acidianus manzaensis]
MKKSLLPILLILIVLEIVSGFSIVNASSLPPLYVEDAANAEIHTLWSKSPTGTYAFHEAPSVNNSFWIDDNAKFLESVAPWWQSYSNPYINDILNFISQGDVNGLFIKRFEYPLNPVQPITIGSLSGYTNGFYDIVGNPIDNTFSIRSYYNPSLAIVYPYGNVIQYPNGILVDMEQGMENPIVDGGFGGLKGQNPPWESVSPFTLTNDSVVSIVNSAKTYLNLTGPDFYGSPSEQLQYNFPIINVLPHGLAYYNKDGILGQYNYLGDFIPFNLTLILQSSSINRVYVLFIWENASGTFVQTDMPVYFPANGQWNMVTVTVPSSVWPKYWNLGDLSSVPLLIGIGLAIPGAEANQTGNTGVYVADVATNYPTTYGPSFTVTNKGSYVIFNESWTSDSLDATFWIAYILGQSDAIEVLASAPVNGSWIYLGYNGLATIGTGYTVLGTPSGILKNYQNANNISWTYLGCNFGKWFLLSTKYAPNWIGAFQLLFMFPMAGSTNPYVDTLSYAAYMGDPVEVRNTLYFGSYTTLPGYFQWVQVAYENNGNDGIFGFFLMPSVDYLVSPNTIVNDLFPSNFTCYNPSSISSYWWTADWGENYYEGEIIYALALLGEYGNTQALSMAEQAWTAYYDQLQSVGGLTYTSSLARFIMATILLYNITHNSQYSNAYTTLGNWLLQYQNDSKYAYVYIPMWYHKDPAVTTVNGFDSYGYIINETSGMDVGTVISGSSIGLNFFEDIPLNTSYGISLITNGTGKLPFTYTNSLNVSGTFTTYLFMNGGGTATTANISITVQIAYDGNILQTIGSATVTNVPIPAGGSSGSPPFYPIKITVPVLTTVNAPPSSTIVVGWHITAPQTVYVLVDSTNGPSNVTIPLSWLNPFYGLFTIPEITNPNPGVHVYPQPYFLDVSAMAGQALVALYYATHNPTYLQRAELIEQAIHYGEVPTPTYGILGVSNPPVTYRLWVYANYSAVDTDYYTYKAELVSEFADAIGNNTLASLAISRVWQRSAYDYPSSYIYYVARYGSGLQMNSETQPWGDVATQDYVDTWGAPNLDLFWASLPQEDYIMNQTWNGTALKIFLYAYGNDQVQLLLLTTTTNFNIIVNGNYTNYGANHQILQIIFTPHAGINEIIIVPNPTNQTSINTGINTSTSSTTCSSSLLNSFNIPKQFQEILGFIIYFITVGLMYLFTRNKIITLLSSLTATVIIYALALWPMYTLFLVGAVSLFMLFYSIRGGGEDGS